mgnify:CR=1 FL=1
MKDYLLYEVDYSAKSLPAEIMALHERHKVPRYLYAITKAAIKEISPDYTPEEFNNLKGWLYMAGHIKNNQAQEDKKLQGYFIIIDN